MTMANKQALRVFGAIALALAASGSVAARSGPNRPVPAHPILGPDGQPQTGLQVIPMTIHSRHGSHSFRVQFARTEEQQQKGLMFRRQMAPDEGMLFPMIPPRVASFWMHNTVIPLDIIYITRDRRIESINANATPYSDDPIYSHGVVSAVLELNGGRAAQLGLAPGDKVVW